MDLAGQPLVMVGDTCGLTMNTRTLFADAKTELKPYPGVADSYRSLEDRAYLAAWAAH